MKKRLFSVFLSFVLILGLLPSIALAADETSGTCGTNATWSFNVSTGTLTISGSGEMEDYFCWLEAKQTPWASYNSRITSVVISNGITRIGNEAFGSECSAGVCENLTSVQIASTVTEIGDFAFANSSLQSVELPNKLSVIQASSFAGTALTAIYIPASVQSMGVHSLYETDGWDPFDGCPLTTITVASENQYYSAENNVLYDKSKTEIISYPKNNAQTSYTIPSTIKTVDLRTFWDAEELKSLVIPDSVTITHDYSLSEGMIDLSQSFALYFLGNAPEDLEEWGMVRDGGIEVSLSIYYVAGTSGWEKYTTKDYWSDDFQGYWMTFQTWTPGSGSDPVAPPATDKDNSNIPIIIVPGIMGSKLYSDANNAMVWGDIWSVLLLDEDKTLDISNLLHTTGLVLEPDNSSLREYGTLDTSKSLVDFLCDEFPERDVYFFSYDWRQSNIDSAKKLKEALIEAGISKFDLVCHSMGGLVAAQYIEACESSREDNGIAHIITLGTPYEGAPKLLNAVLTNQELDLDGIASMANPIVNYLISMTTETKSELSGVAELSPAIEYWKGVSGNHIIQYAVADRIKISDVVRYGFETPVEGATNLTSLKFLISKSLAGTYDKLDAALTALEDKYAQNGYSLYDIEIMTAKNIGLSGDEKYIVPIITTTIYTDYVDALNSIFSSGKLQESMTNVQSAIQKLLHMNNAYFAIGDHQLTMTGASLVKDLDGTIFFDDCSYGIGDGTVPYKSAAMLLNVCPVNAAYFDLNHGDLANGSGSEWNKLTAWISGILNSEAVTARTTATAASPYTVIRVACPVDVVIEKNGEILTNIAERYSAEASYGIMDLLGQDGEIKMFCLGNGDYSITLSGTGTGTMDYAIRFYSSENELLDERIFEDVSITETTRITTNSTQDYYTELRIDENGDGIVDQTIQASNHIIDSDSNGEVDTPSINPPVMSSTNTIHIPTAGHGTITASPSSAAKGAAVTITATPDAGYELSTLTVTDAIGNSLVLTDEGGGKFTFTMPASAVKVNASFVKAGASRFADVPDNYWAKDAINWAYENGFMKGTTATTFNPGGYVTRQQLWMVLARLSGEQPANMAAARAWAMERGVSDGSNPTRGVTRQQMVTILYRWAKLQGYDVSANADLTRFPDHSSVENYAKDAVSWSVAEGIINGTSQGLLSPTGKTSRAVFATILMRFVENAAK